MFFRVFDDLYEMLGIVPTEELDVTPTGRTKISMAGVIRLSLWWRILSGTCTVSLIISCVFFVAVIVLIGNSYPVSSIIWTGIGFVFFAASSVYCYQLSAWIEDLMVGKR